MPIAFFQVNTALESGWHNAVSMLVPAYNKVSFSPSNSAIIIIIRLASCCSYYIKTSDGYMSIE